MYENAIQQNSFAKNHYHLNAKTFTQLNKKNYFVNAYNKSITALQKNGSAQNKLIYGVNVDTTFINEVTATNYKSYTFKIIDPIESQTFFKNLIIEIDGQQRVSAEVAKYNIDFDKKIVSVESTVIIPREMEEVPLTSDTSKCIYYEIITQTSCGCVGQHYDDDADCDCPESPPTTTVQMIVDCTGGGEGAGGGPSGNNGPSNNGGGAGNEGLGIELNFNNNPTPIITAPIHGEDPTYHSRSLKSISDNIKVRVKINSLIVKNSNPNQIQEDGFQFIKNGNDFDIKLPYSVGPNTTNFFPSFLPNTLLVLHMHPVKAYNFQPGQAPVLANISPLFSDDDVYAFMGFGDFTNFNNKNITAMLVSRAGVFALRMEDKTKMKNAFQAFEDVGIDSNGFPIPSPDMKNFRDAYYRRVIEPCDDNDDAAFIIHFTNFINTYTLLNGQTLGISLFKATMAQQGNIAPYVDSWNQLITNP